MLQMIVRMVIGQLMRKGVSSAMKMGGDALARRGGRGKRTADEGEEIVQDPAIATRRKRHADERRGDEVLYPTDEFTEPMQPRR